MSERASVQAKRLLKAKALAGKGENLDEINRTHRELSKWSCFGGVANLVAEIERLRERLKKQKAKE